MTVITPERYRENLEVALVTLITVCKRWPDAPLVVQRAIDVGSHVLTNGVQPAVEHEIVSSSGRYMTPHGKSEELASWFKAKADRIANPPEGFVGGHGYPDPEIYAWCEKLNGLSRVCTLQSCAGHKCTPELSCAHCAGAWRCATCGSNATDCFYRQHSSYTKQDKTARHEFSPRTDAEHVWNAQLWLWLELRMSVWFYQHAPQLAALPCVEKVAVLWHVEGREIVDIVFKGAGTGDLDDSMTQIVAFFENGNRLCNLG